MTKRIIDNKTYNTETATLLAEEPLRGRHKSEFDSLYQTRHGAYFRHNGDMSLNTEKGMLEDITPLSPEEAKAWMAERNWVKLLETHFGEQAEAGEAESRITLRIPDGLRRRIDVLAVANNQSLNAWIMRCVEGCVGRQTVA